MSFYGNITNTTKTGFSFDKTYSNRKEMDDNAKKDGIYIGRFVLVDYDKDAENARPAYYKEGMDKYLYSDRTLNNIIRYNQDGMILDEHGTITGVGINDVCYINAVLSDGGTTRKFYICVGGDDRGYALFDEFRYNSGHIENPSYNHWKYAINYSIDQAHYGDYIFGGSIGKGWDSTVWQKTYENGAEKYVMIAELNAVVPTFAISQDPPTTTPIAPHFDEISNNTYYEIHWQPQWGMRVKSADNLLTSDESAEAAFSDEYTTWIMPFYNEDASEVDYFYYGTDEEWYKIPPGDIQIFLI